MRVPRVPLDSSDVVIVVRLVVYSVLLLYAAFIVGLAVSVFLYMGGFR